MLIAALILAAPLLQEPTRSLFKEVVPQPTGKNGYEEYVRAADLIRQPDFGAYSNWRTGFKTTYAGVNVAELDEAGRKDYDLRRRLAGMDRIAVFREMADRFEQAIPLVIQGTEKAVFNPRSDPDGVVIYPELAQFRNLSRLLVADAHVKFADGLTQSATHRLSDQLQFAQKIQQGTILHGLVGIACSAIGLSAYEERLMNMTPQDLQYTRRTVTDLLRDVPPIAEILAYEGKMVSRGIDRIPIDKPVSEPQEEALASQMNAPMEVGAVGAEEEEPYDWQPDFYKLSKQRRESIRAEAVKRVNTLYATWRNRITQGEPRWLSGIPEPKVEKNGMVENPPPTDDDGLADAVGMIKDSESILYQYVGAVLRNRAQLRLLLLHTYVLNFRWSTGRLPTNLGEAAPADAIRDYLAGDAFQYKTTGPHSYRIFSKGNKSLGEVDLRYRRVSSVANEEPGYEPPAG